MWRRKDPEEYGNEVRDFEREDGKFIVSLAGNAGIWFTWEGVGDFLFQENKQIHRTPGWLQAGVFDRQL